MLTKTHNAEVLAIVAKARKEKAELRSPRNGTYQREGPRARKARSTQSALDHVESLKTAYNVRALKSEMRIPVEVPYWGVLDARTLLCSDRALCVCGSGFRAAGRHSRASDGTH
ncbi:hypothetical protein SBA2_430007 [Acidobacteriia bacterium SbA2]|nr:hypothetical protein SBA2_430007 [Acidobacteriia bacterium SbA2]